MKKILLPSLLAIISLYTYAIPQIKPGLTCDIDNDNYYVLEFMMPAFHEEEDTIEMNYHEYYFSCIRPDSSDYFNYLEEDGRPELPFYSVDLILSPDVSQFEIFSVEIIDSVIVPLHSDYKPAQSKRFSMEDDIAYDDHFYNLYDPAWYGQFCKVDESNYRGQKGLNCSIFPCRYDPLHRELNIVTKARCIIKFDGHGLPAHLDSVLSILDRSTFYYYDNIREVYPRPIIPPIHGDEYLILTTGRWYNNEDLLNFVAHKESLGYHVTYESLQTIGSTPAAIRSYIQMLYREHGLKYVLLVGDHDELPFSAGVHEDTDAPPTDIFYACLSKNNMSDQWKDFSPSVFLGRWPVQNTDQLHNIVRKTIFSDMNLGEYDPKKIGIFSGNERYFYQDCQYIYKNIVQNYHQYYTGDLFDGRTLSGSGYNVMKNYLEDTHCDPTWMFVYSGHASQDAGISMIHAPYFVNYSNIDYIYTSPLHFQSFGFGFACRLGNIFASDNFARSWVTSTEGGVTFLGATTNTSYTPDRYFSRKLFLQLGGKPIITIGEFIGNGKAKYYNCDKVIWRQREAEKYILYGDPSLYLFGLDIQHESIGPIFLQPVRKDSKSEIDQTQSIRIYSISGHLLFDGNIDQMNLQNLPTGVYIATITTETEQFSKKIVIK